MRDNPEASKREALRLATWDSTIALMFALTVNASILILAAATFATAGAAFGRLAHLLDALDDLDGDRRAGRWNPVDATGAGVASTRALARRQVDILATTLDGDYILHDALGLTGSKEAGIPNHFKPISLEELVDHDVTHMPVRVLDPDLADALAAQVAGTGEGRIDAIRSHGFFDVIAAGRTKGDALRVLEALLVESGTSLELTAAVGDSWNDVPMFEVVDRPCAMAGSPDDVVAAAGGTTTPSVAAFIESLLTDRG